MSTDNPNASGVRSRSPVLGGQLLAIPESVHTASLRSSLDIVTNPFATPRHSQDSEGPVRHPYVVGRPALMSSPAIHVDPFATPRPSAEPTPPLRSSQAARKPAVTFQPETSNPSEPRGPSTDLVASHPPSHAGQKDIKRSIFSRLINTSVWSTGSMRTVDSIRTYRSRSSNSPLYMFKDLVASSQPLPYENTALSDEDFEVFANLAKGQQILEAPNTRSKSVFRLVYLTFILAIVYFVLIGRPLWQGTVYWFWTFFHDEEAQKSIWGLIGFIVAGTLRNILPQVLCTFDRPTSTPDSEKPRDASECCVVIPCYKSAEILRSTLPACLAIFSPEQIFVVANGNSPVPLDHTADVCAEYGVRHCWVPVGSKITAEFVGVALARKYKYCMLIDDDVILPTNLSLPTELFGDAEDSKVACVGYTIKSVGKNSSKGTLIQQVQDIEYKIAGLAKVFQSHYASVIFPHGAIALWRRDILERIFHGHPGYHISEDWFLGHTARAAGYRTVMSSQVFVETETPPRLFPAWFGKKGASRGGYGEMSVYKQRFYRWNFFFIFRIWSNLTYVLFSWRLGWREIITKLYVAGECYDTLIWLLAPIVVPTSLAASWRLTLIVAGGLLVFNLLIVVWFNLVHLNLLRRGRKDDERVAWIAFPAYMFLKFVMLFVNIASIYWSIYEYAFFFTKQHLRVTESVEAWQVIRNNLNHVAV